MVQTAIMINPGEEYQSHASNKQRHYLGTKGVTPDGRVFRYSLMAGTIGVAGNLYSTVAPEANHDELAVDTARAVGAQQISCTLGTVAAAVDLYAEGYAIVNKAAGIGHLYWIERAWKEGQGHEAAAASAVITLNLASPSSVKVALTTSSELTLLQNKFKNVVITATTVVAGVVGVAPWAATAEQFCWLQTGGPAAVFTNGAVVIGQHVREAGATAPGAVQALDRDGTHENEAEVGIVLEVGATTEMSIIDLTLDRG
jgi:hypothetical protein